MANKYNHVLYVGVTNDLIRRIYEHKHKLMYYEVCSDIVVAIEWEKQIKGWSRDKKNALVQTINPDWNDLYDSLTDQGCYKICLIREEILMGNDMAPARKRGDELSTASRKERLFLAIALAKLP
ncbi:MAG: GIY-YIG nuclease family protein [Legionellaceae bacterium]|nr:GIY-YIG nuclease family protein [Legionellaceae bacterium]